MSGVQAPVPSCLASGPPSATAARETPTVHQQPRLPAPAPSLVPAPSSVSSNGSTESTLADFLLPSLGLPHIPAKLVQAIKEGKFVDFEDLLPETLREYAFEAVSSQKDEKKKRQ